MGIFDGLFGRTSQAKEAPMPVTEPPAPPAPPPVPEPQAPAEPTPEEWADALLARRDYRSLAAINNSQDYSGGQATFIKRRIANHMLVESGSEAVDAVLAELELDGVGKSELADVLVKIGDPKAVPLLRRMYERGDFKAYATHGYVHDFTDKYPELAGETETAECDRCGKTRPVTEMQWMYDDSRVRHFYCFDECWDLRGSVMNVSEASPKECRFFSEGMCSAGGGSNLCSYRGASYRTDCFVYGANG